MMIHIRLLPDCTNINFFLIFLFLTYIINLILRYKNNPFMTFDNVQSEADQVLELVKDPDGNLFLLKNIVLIFII